MKSSEQRNNASGFLQEKSGRPDIAAESAKTTIGAKAGYYTHADARAVSMTNRQQHTPYFIVAGFRYRKLLKLHSGSVVHPQLLLQRFQKPWRPAR